MTTVDWAIVNQGAIIWILVLLLLVSVLIAGVSETAKVLLLPITLPIVGLLRTVNFAKQLFGIAGDSDFPDAGGVFKRIDINPLPTRTVMYMETKSNVAGRLLLVALFIGTSIAGIYAGWTGHLKPISSLAFLELPDRYCPDREQTDTLLIFIHGWNGETGETWKRFPDLACQDDRLKTASVMSFDYPTFMLRRNLHIAELADLLVKTEKATSNLKNYRKVILVSHSMGGLVAREMALQLDHARSTYKPHLIVEIAAPHLGASLAILGKMLGVDKEHSEEAAPGSSFLASQTVHWNSMQTRPKTSCFTSPQDLVVTSASATYQCDSSTSYTSGDHREIVKPQSRKDLIYALPISEVLQEMGLSP